MKDKNKKYPEGYFASLGMGIGIAVFSGLGILLCTVTKNYGLIGVGPAVGVPIGLSIGQGIEKKIQKNR
ncbi:MAG: hypothetical protein H6502_05295 [Candidatus Woesearchaeota archaeon]|nr:MAG: hypothetical protein H6502_05295 [Candidatus Woesearchaeota archaeon]